MAEQDRGSDDPQLAEIARHALHDEELIAALTADDLDDAADADRARALVERCGTCRDLHADLVAIRSAIRASGTAAQRATTMAAPRDFRLTADDAARLRPDSPVARLAVGLGWRARLSHGVAAVGSPLGAAMTALGVVGLLVGSLALGGVPPASMSGGAAGAPSGPGTDTSGAEATASRASYLPAETPKSGTSGTTETGDGARGSTAAIVIVGSIAFVLLGIGLILAARRTARPASPSGNQ